MKRPTKMDGCEDAKEIDGKWHCELYETMCKYKVPNEDKCVREENEEVMKKIEEIRKRILIDVDKGENEWEDQDESNRRRDKEV